MTIILWRKAVCTRCLAYLARFIWGLVSFLKNLRSRTTLPTALKQMSAFVASCVRGDNRYTKSSTHVATVAVAVNRAGRME